jgi:hypothetical protein
VPCAGRLLQGYYAWSKRSLSRRAKWLNVGVAFAHEDGEGFNILLQALPTDAKLVLRTYKEKPEEQEKVIKAKFKK